MTVTLPETLSIPPGDSRRELLGLAATAFAVWLAGCVVISVVHFLT